MRVAFFGTPEFGRRVLAALLDAGEEVVLVISQPDRPRRRRGRGPAEPSPVKRLALERELPVVTPERAEAAAGALEQAAPDVCVVAAYGQILPDSLLELAGGRWLNVHGSLLPAYRGAAPVSQAILDGLTETGVTVMEVIPALDAGPVVSQATVPIADDDTTGSLSAKLAEAGGRLLAETLPKYQSGKLRPKPQDESAATMTRTLKKTDGRIDWNRDAAALARFVRAMQPWPGAWTTFGGAPVTVTAAHPAAGSDDGVAPGTFGGTPPLAVGTGAGRLVIDRLVPSGRREMDGAAWLRGVRQSGHFDT